MPSMSDNLIARQPDRVCQRTWPGGPERSPRRKLAVQPRGRAGWGGGRLPVDKGNFTGPGDVAVGKRAANAPPEVAS